MQNRHVMTNQVVDYWKARGGSAAERLADHGVPASMEEEQRYVDGRMVRVLHFQFGTFGKILVAELIADRLDEIRAEIMDAMVDGEEVN